MPRGSRRRTSRCSNLLRSTFQSTLELQAVQAHPVLGSVKRKRRHVRPFAVASLVPVHKANDTPHEKSDRRHRVNKRTNALHSKEEGQGSKRQSTSSFECNEENRITASPQKSNATTTHSDDIAISKNLFRFCAFRAAAASTLDTGIFSATACLPFVPFFFVLLFFVELDFLPPERCFRVAAAGGSGTRGRAPTSATWRCLCCCSSRSCR